MTRWNLSTEHVDDFNALSSERDVVCVFLCAAHRWSPSCCAQHSVSSPYCLFYVWTTFRTVCICSVPFIFDEFWRHHRHSLAKKPPKPILLEKTDTLKLTFQVVEKDTGNGVQPHQTFLRFYDKTTGEEGIQPIRVTSGGKAKFELVRLPRYIYFHSLLNHHTEYIQTGVVVAPDLWRSLASHSHHWISSTLPPLYRPLWFDHSRVATRPSSPSRSIFPSSSWNSSHFPSRTKASPETGFCHLLCRGSCSLDGASWHGKCRIILHPIILLIDHLQWSQVAPRVTHLLSPNIFPFIATLGAFESLLVWYWVDLKLGQVLLYGGFLSIVTVLTGKHALSKIGDRRLGRK